MSYLHPALRARILAQIQAKETLLADAEAAYSSSLKNSEIQTYSFDSGEGKQMTVRRKPVEIRKEIDAITAELNGLYSRLGSSGIVSMNMRRR